MLLCGGSLAGRRRDERNQDPGHRAGPIELSVKEKKTVNVPAWAGVGAIAAGAILLLARPKG